MSESKAGRPPKEFDKETFEGLCEIQCTQAEICNVLRTSDKTLSRWVEDTYGMSYSEAYKTYADMGKKSLRRLQFESAHKGNTAMLIWLGKQYLGQKDKSEVTENLATIKLDSLIEQLEQDDSNTEA
jgi:hypothetical protein